MLRLSRKTLLALEAVIDIAFNARPEPVQAKEITARQGVPQRPSCRYGCGRRSQRRFHHLSLEE
jgi:hypothetical protein